MTHHVVCRACTYKRLEGTVAEAARKARIHTRLTTHDVDHRRVEVRRGCSWRPVGVEAVSGVVVTRERSVGEVVEVDDGR